MRLHVETSDFLGMWALMGKHHLRALCFEVQELHSGPELILHSTTLLVTWTCLLNNGKLVILTKEKKSESPHSVGSIAPTSPVSHCEAIVLTPGGRPDRQSGGARN